MDKYNRNIRITQLVMEIQIKSIAHNTPELEVKTNTQPGIRNMFLKGKLNLKVNKISLI